MREPTRKGHRGVVNGGHLRREHGLHLILRLYPLDHCEHEIESPFVHRSPLSPNIGELPEEPIQEIWIRSTKGLHEEDLADLWLRMVRGKFRRAFFIRHLYG